MTRDPAGTRPPDRALLSRSAIVTEARRLLATEGVKGLSLRRLASRLRVTAPALYAHVRDKRDLMQAIADVELEALIDRFHAVGAETEPLECIRRRALDYVAYAQAEPQLFCALFMLEPELTSEPWEGQRPLTAKALEVAAEPIHRAIASGQLRALDPALTSSVMWSVMHGVAVHLVSGPPLEPAVAERLAETAIDATLAGLAVAPA